MELTNGEKIQVTKNRLFNYACNVFQCSGIDASLGCIILDAVKADLLSLGYAAIAERSALEIEALLKEKSVDDSKKD